MLQHVRVNPVSVSSVSSTWQVGHREPEFRSVPFVIISLPKYCLLWGMYLQLLEFALSRFFVASTSVLLLLKMKRGIANSSGCQLFPTFRWAKYQRYLKVLWLSDRGTRGCVRNRNISDYKCWNSISTVYATPDAHSGSVTLQHSSEAMGLCIFI